MQNDLQVVNYYKRNLLGLYCTFYIEKDRTDLSSERAADINEPAIV
jgi:hypothetical protein